MDLHTTSTEPFVSDTIGRRHSKPMPKKSKQPFAHSDHTRHVVSLKGGLRVSHTAAMIPPSLNVLYASVISYYPHHSFLATLNARRIPTRNFSAALSLAIPVAWACLSSHSYSAASKRIFIHIWVMQEGLFSISLFDLVLCRAAADTEDCIVIHHSSCVF